MKRKKTICLILIGLGLTILTGAVMGQEKKSYKEIKRTLKSDIINVSADSLWTILRAFDKVSHWASALDHSEGAGKAKFEGTTCNERVCLQKNKKLVEELIMFNDENMELAYVMTEGAPGFVKLAKNHWTVHEISTNKSLVQMNVTMHLSKFMGFFLGGIITKEMTKQVATVLNDLKTYAETGEISETKKVQISKLKKKSS